MGIFGFHFTFTLQKATNKQKGRLGSLDLVPRQVLEKVNSEYKPLKIDLVSHPVHGEVVG